MQHNFISILLNKTRDSKVKFSYKKKMSAKDAFLLTEKELKRLNTILRSGKVISDDSIGNTIFTKLKGEIDEHELNNYAGVHFTAGYYSFIQLRERMEKENNFDYRGIKIYGFLITAILFDLIPFANYAGKKQDENYAFINGGKTNIEDSKWHYLGTNQLLFNSIFNKKMLDDKFALILSPVALRQTLELKMQRILGVADYFDLKGNRIFTNHYFFFEYILKNKEFFELSGINIKIIQKIFDFCNLSVHKGVMPFVWQMLYAIKFCDPLFYDVNYKPNARSMHIHSSVKISNYDELKAKLETDLKLKFPEPEFDLFIHWITPEAQLIR